MDRVVWCTLIMGIIHIIGGGLLAAMYGSIRFKVKCMGEVFKLPVYGRIAMED